MYEREDNSIRSSPSRIIQDRPITCKKSTKQTPSRIAERRIYPESEQSSNAHTSTSRPSTSSLESIIQDDEQLMEMRNHVIQEIRMAQIMRSNEQLTGDVTLIKVSLIFLFLLIILSYFDIGFSEDDDGDKIRQVQLNCLERFKEEKCQAYKQITPLCQALFDCSKAQKDGNNDEDDEDESAFIISVGSIFGILIFIFFGSFRGCIRKIVEIYQGNGRRRRSRD